MFNRPSWVGISTVRSVVRVPRTARTRIVSCPVQSSTVQMWFTSGQGNKNNNYNNMTKDLGSRI